MLAAVSSREISEWQAFEAEHGPVHIRPDWSAALVASTLANIHRDPKSHPEPYGLGEFMMGGVPEYEQTPEQMAAVFEITAAAERARERRMEELPK